MLHTVNKSPFERNNLDNCLRTAQTGDAVLLIEDGVYAALKGTAHADTVAKAVKDLKVYVLGNDLTARGMAPDKVIEGITVVDYGGFVDLTAEHSVVQSWL